MKPGLVLFFAVVLFFMLLNAYVGLVLRGHYALLTMGVGAAVTGPLLVLVRRDLADAFRQGTARGRGSARPHASSPPAWMYSQLVIASWGLLVTAVGVVILAVSAASMLR
jgi:hypothetical protein